MVFIEGVGYVNDSSAIATPNRTQSVSETTTNFDGMLRTETDKLNQASVTTNLDSIFKEAADKYSVPERLLKAIAYTESGFQADVTSFSGAMGIMQLMPSTASAYPHVRLPAQTSSVLSRTIPIYPELNDTLSSCSSSLIHSFRIVSEIRDLLHALDFLQPVNALLRNLLIAFHDHNRLSATAGAIQLHVRNVHAFM